MTTCDCAACFTGVNCGLDLNFCTPCTCLNGGTCIEGYGTETACMCTEDFIGPHCAIYIAGKFELHDRDYSNQCKNVALFSKQDNAEQAPHWRDCIASRVCMCVCMFACGHILEI